MAEGIAKNHNNIHQYITFGIFHNSLFHRSVAIAITLLNNISFYNIKRMISKQEGPPLSYCKRSSICLKLPPDL